MTKRDKQLLRHFGFKIVITSSEFEPDFKQYVKYIKHPVLQGLYISIDDKIYIWCQEDREGISGDSVLLSTRKFTEKNLLEIMINFS